MTMCCGPLTAFSLGMRNKLGRDRSPVGRLVFKTRRGGHAVLGRFDSCSLPPPDAIDDLIEAPLAQGFKAALITLLPMFSRLLQVHHR